MHTGKLSPRNLVRTGEKETDSDNTKFITISSELKENNQLEMKNPKPQSSSESKKVKPSKPNLT